MERKLQAIEAAQRGAFAAAREHLDAYRTDHPEDVDARVLEASIALFQDDVAEARRLLEEALTAFPGHVDLLTTLAVVHEKQGAADAAAACYRSALPASNAQQRPKIQEALARLGVAEASTQAPLFRPGALKELVEKVLARERAGTY